MKTYHQYISLGFNCEIGFQLRRIQNKDISYYFNWLFIPIDSLIKIIENNFSNVFHKENLLFQDENNLEMITDKFYGISFHNPFKSIGKVFEGPIFESLHNDQLKKLELFRRRFFSVISSKYEICYLLKTNSKDDEYKIKIIKDLFLKKNPHHKFTIVWIVEGNSEPIEIDSYITKFEIKKFAPIDKTDSAANNEDWDKLFKAFPLSSNAIFNPIDNLISFKPTEVNSLGLTSLIKNLGRDCSPSQYLREFLKNSIEACQRTQNKRSHITIDFNSEVFESEGVYKISFTDDGDGMSPIEMLSLLNNLSSSGPSLNEHQNYGVGAKISAMTRNHEGIQYESWKGGEGYKVLICYQKESDIFGVQGFKNDVDEIIYAIPLTNKGKPKMIDQHGTRVTLFGMYDSQDTMATPHGLPFDRDGWIVEYLNSRFLKMPSNIEIKTRYGYQHPITDTDNNYLKSILGFQAIANKESELKGVTRLKNANVFWWILPQNSTLKGHTAFINQDEVFDISDARTNRLTHFGIMVGRDRVIIYVEPDDVEQSTSRSHLVKKDGSNVDWSPYQDEFKNNLPQEIRDFIDQMLNETSQVSFSKIISKRLKSIHALFLLSGYKPLQIKRQPKLAPENLSAKTIADNKTEKESPEAPISNPNAPEENLAPELDINLFPTVEWTNELSSPQLSGRAAEYIESSNLVLANADFKGFKDLIQYFLDKYAGTENLDTYVVSAVNEVVEQALMECVAGALSLRDQPHWNPHQSHLSLTTEAITMAMMQRYWMANFVDQKIRQELMKP